MTENHFRFVCPMYNAASTMQRLLHSLYGQSYKNWSIVLIDDVSSDDQFKSCERIIQQFNSFDQHAFLIRNDEKRWETYNVLRGIKTCGDTDIVCRIDADDAMCDLDALVMLNQLYNVPEVEAVWTMHRWGQSDKNISAELDDRADVYKHPWVSSHLKTFRKKYINDVPWENFLNKDNVPVKRCGDQAIYLPVLQRIQSSGKRWLFMPRAVYSYTIDDRPETYQTDDAKYQRDEAIDLRYRGYVNAGDPWEKFVTICDGAPC